MVVESLIYSSFSMLSGMESRSIMRLGGYCPGFGSMQAVKEEATKSAAKKSESFIFVISYNRKIHKNKSSNIHD